MTGRAARPLRVLVDASYAARAPQSGTAVYTDCLLAAFAAADGPPGVRIAAVANRRRRPPAGGGLGSARNLLADRVWEAAVLPRLARRADAVVVHHALPARARLPARVAQVITVHDLAFLHEPEAFARGWRAVATRAHAAAARHAAVVICVSAATAEDVRERWAILPERIVIARHGPGPVALIPRPGPPTAPPPDAPFLYVGDGEPRKALPVLLAAYARYRAATTADRAAPRPLVLAGTLDPAIAAGSPGVRIVHRPATGELAALLHGAFALVHPARHEGFGLPVLEAMAAGVPVVAARSAAVAELTGADSALLVTPGDAVALAAGLRRIAAEPLLRARLAVAGRVRATAFSWAASARTHAEAYALAVEIVRRGRR